MRLLLLLSFSCATMQMREIERIRGPREAAYDWPIEDQREIQLLVAEGKVIAVDRDDNILSTCTTGAVYRTRGRETELVEVSSPILGGDCDGASDIISGFSTSEDGRLLALSFAQLESTEAGPTMELLLAKTKIEAGELEGRWILHDEAGAPLCDLPCVRWFMPERDHRVGFVQRSDEEHTAHIPWDPLHPGGDLNLELRQARPQGVWPYIPITQMLVGLGGAAGLAAVIAEGRFGGGLDALAAPFVLGALTIVSGALGVYGMVWLLMPPEREPLLRVKRASR